MNDGRDYKFPTDKLVVCYRLTVSLLPRNSVFLTRACAHYKFLNPCHRCHLAKLFDNQGIVGNNEVTTVTRKGELLIEMPPITVADAFAHREERHLSERGNITIFNRRHPSL